MARPRQSPSTNPTDPRYEDKRAWAERNREKRNEINKRSHRLRWDQVLDHYGRRCACCGETDERFFTVDHMLNDGAAHRRANHGMRGPALHYWIVKHGFPPTFQILCWNCNCGRHYNGGVCPHQDLA